MSLMQLPDYFAHSLTLLQPNPNPHRSYFRSLERAYVLNEFLYVEELNVLSFR